MMMQTRLILNQFQRVLNMVHEFIIFDENIHGLGAIITG